MKDKMEKQLIEQIESLRKQVAELQQEKASGSGRKKNQGVTGRERNTAK